MSGKNRDKEKEWEQEHSPSEKPISLAGSKFKDVLRALLETNPMSKEGKKGEGNGKRRQE